MSKLFWCVILTLFLIGPTFGDKMASDQVLHFRHEALQLLNRALITTSGSTPGSYWVRANAW